MADYGKAEIPTNQQSNPTLAEEAAAAEVKAKLEADGALPSDGDKLFAGKYKTVEELEKGYEEAQKLLSDPNKDDKEATPPKAKDAKIEVPDGAPVGLTPDKMADYTEHYAEHGELSEEIYTELATLGIPKEIADDYIATKNEILQSQANTIFEEFGGLDHILQQAEWAVENYSEAEIKSYNEALDSGDVETIRTHIRALQARHSDAEGQTPSLVAGSVGPGESGAVYRSIEEMTKDQRDPRYRTDPAFNEAVVAKVQRSINMKSI